MFEFHYEIYAKLKRVYLMIMLVTNPLYDLYASLLIAITQE